MSRPAKPQPVRLAYGDIVNGGEFSAKMNDGNELLLNKIPPEPIVCLPPGASYRVLGSIGQPPNVNAVTAKPGRNGKPEFFHLPDDFLVTFFPRFQH